MNKTAIFIDGANLYGGMKKHDPYMQIDFIKLSKELTGNRQIIRVYYYTAPPILQQNPTDDQKNEYSKTLHFIESLKLLPYFNLTSKRLSPVSSVEKNDCPQPPFFWEDSYTLAKDFFGFLSPSCFGSLRIFGNLKIPQADRILSSS